MIISEIRADNLSARKNKNRYVAGITGCLLGEIESVGKTKGNRDTTEKEAEIVIRKFLKGAQENVTFMADSGADSKELEKYIEEISIYEKYLPDQLSQEELTKIIVGLIDGLDDPNIGKLMAVLKLSNYSYDGKMASTIIRNLI